MLAVRSGRRDSWEPDSSSPSPLLSSPLPLLSPFSSSMATKFREDIKGLLGQYGGKEG